MSARPRGSADNPLRADYAHHLREWRAHCGSPAFRYLKRQIDCPTATIHDRISTGRGLTLPFIEAFVAACHRYAGLDGEPDLATWRWEFNRMRKAEARAAGGVVEHGEPLTVGLVPAQVRGYRSRPDGPSPRPGQDLVLTGLGGAGKTQLAVELVQRVVAEHRARLIIWVDASNPANAVARLAEAAREFDVTTGRGPDADAIRFCEWLTSPDAPPSLVVYDNADPAVHELWPHAGPGSRCTTIVTTRRHGAALAAGGREIVTVDLFTPDESVSYLASVLGHEDPDAPALAEELGHLPLALSQAAAFMKDRHLSCLDYLARLRTRALEEVFPEHPELPDDQREPLPATWRLSIDAADQARPVAVARPMLEIAAMLDAGGIPIAVLTAGPCLDLLARRLGHRPSAEDARDGLSGLERQSLGQLDDRRGTFWVHRLVQRAVRESLTPDTRVELIRCAADALREAWPAVARAVSDSVLLRANAAALERIGDGVLWDGRLHQVVFQAGNSLYDERLTKASIDYWTRLRARAETRLDADHDDTLTLENNLAWAYGRDGDAPRALQMLQEVHEVRTRKNGPRAVNTLATEHGIAYWLVESGRTAEAAKILTRLIRDYEREPEIGPGHKDTLNARLLLTETYAEAETYADAEPADAVIGQLRELLEDCRRALGGDAWITLDVVDALALRLAQDGQAATAAEVMEDALPAYARAHGDYGVETFQARFKHVVLLHLVGETPRALTALRALVADAEAHLGPGHAETQQFRETLDAWSAG